MNIAIIPARSKSKRIKNKNIKLFHGKPIIYWAIKSAIKSKIFDKVIVSTDSKTIKKISLKFGAEVPFLRPKKYSGDFSTTRDVIKHALKMQNTNININCIACIYPTAAIINYKDLIYAYKQFNLKKKKSYIFSAIKYSYPVQRSFYFKKKKIINLFKNQYHKRSQDLENVYHDAGQYYFFTKEMIRKNINIFSKNSYPVFLKEINCQDIDNLNDWKIAELKFKLRYKIG